jgi:subtilisin family serine protease
MGPANSEYVNLIRDPHAAIQRPPPKRWKRAPQPHTKSRVRAGATSRLTVSIVSAVAVALSAVVPTGAAAASDVPWQARWAIGFESLPSAVAVGGSYAGDTIVHVDEQLGFISVETDDAEGLMATASQDQNVRYVDASPAAVQFIPVPVGGGMPFDAQALLDAAGGAALATSNDPSYPAQYGPQHVAAPAAWEYTRGSTTAAVCVVDTGVRRSHQDIGTSRWLGWKDFVNGRSTPYDDHGHGTHVAGIAAAGVNNGTGIAGMGNIGIYAAKVLDSAGSGSWEDVAAGIVWCADRGNSRTVINLSLGTSGSAPTYVQDALSYAYGTRGRLVVAAAGNDACSGCAYSPAKYSQAIAVGCTDGSKNRCSFSNTGSNLELAAPGETILSTYATSNTSYAEMSGTSMSAPHVAGALALAWSYHTGWSNTTLRSRAQASALDRGATGHDASYGYGLVDTKCLITLVPHVARTVAASAGPGAGKITVTWAVPVHDCGASISGYDVYRAAPGGSYAKIGSTAGGARSFADSGLDPGVTRYYLVLAVNAHGTSRSSNVASARTFTTPSAPSAVSAAPGSGISQITVRWNQPLDDGGTGVSNYRVYRADASTGPYSVVATRNGLSRTWTDSDVTVGLTYHYKVAAVNAVGTGALSASSCSKPFPWVVGLC